MSVDYSFSIARDPRREEKNRGAMWRLRYAKAFAEIESSLSLLAQYYPKQRYRTFRDAISQQAISWWGWMDGEFIGEFESEKKTHYELRYNQYLTESNSIYLTFSKEKLRGRKKGESSVELGFSGSWGDIDYSVYGEYSRPAWGKEEAQINFTVSIPLDFLSMPRVKLNLDNTRTKNGNNIRRVGLSGTALDDYSLNYSLDASQQRNKGTSVDASADYQYNAGELRMGYSQGRGYRQQNVDVTGSVMLWQAGITLGQSLGETLAIVQIPDSPGISVDNQYGTTTDGQGAAVVSNLTPYRVNRLTLNSWDLPPGITLPENEQEVVPTAGAIMFSQFGKAVRKTPGDSK